MRIRFQHAVHEVRRETRELAFGFGRDVTARCQAAVGDGERAILSHAQAIRFARAYRQSLASYRRLDSLIERFGDFDLGLDVAPAQPQRFVAFVGYSRSGHSLLGSLLDAHPDAVIAHELHALKHCARGRAFPRVVRASRQNARIFRITGRRYTGYDYVVPDQWQGATRSLRIVGDKKGNGSARLLRREPEALARICERVPVPIDLIHVVRNPYDNIATKALRTGRSLDDAAAIYFANAHKIASLKASSAISVHDVHLEDLIAEPRTVLSRVLTGLGLDPNVPGYLNACAEILFESPNRTRDRVAWPRDVVATIERSLARLAFTQRYAGTIRE